MAIDQEMIRQIKAEHASAPRGLKTAVVKRYAKITGYSVTRLWEMIGVGRKRRKEVDKTEELKKIAEAVTKIKYRGADGMTPVSTDQAYSLALKNDVLPEGARRYSISSINRMRRELNLNKETRRVQRFQAEWPNQMHHVDASTSKFFYADKKLEDGDYILKLHSPAQNYKNKPTPLHQNVWIYGIVDDHSGLAAARATVAPGESALDNLEFLEWAWTATDDKIFCGLPQLIKADKGPMMRSKAIEDLFHRLSVGIDPSVPGAKDTHGKIERPWRTHFQRFERQFLVLDNWQNFKFRLSELNRQMLTYLNEEYNQRPHRFEKNITREQSWRRIHKLGGIKPLPEGAIKTAFRKIERKINRDGTFNLDNKIYEVKGLHDARANILTNIFTNEMVAEAMETGTKYEVIDFEPTPVGTFRAHKETPLQKIKKMSADLSINKTMFEEDAPKSNVRPMPIKTQEEPKFNRIFNIGAFNSVKDAMNEFQMLTMTFPEEGSEDRSALEQLFIDNGLSKEFVKKTAHDFINYREKESRRYGNV